MVWLCESNIFLCVRPSSVHLSVTLSPPKPLGGIQLATSQPLMVRVCMSNIIFTCVRRPFICLSVTLSPPKPLGGKKTKLATWPPVMVMVSKSKPVHPSVMLLATSVEICDGATSTAHSSFVIVLNFVKTCGPAMCSRSKIKRKQTNSQRSVYLFSL